MKNYDYKICKLLLLVITMQFLSNLHNVYVIIITSGKHMTSGV